MKRCYHLLLLIIYLLSTNYCSAQCDFYINDQGFEYTLDVNLEVTDVLFTQNGSTCNVQGVVSYDVSTVVLNKPEWSSWPGNMYTLHGNLNCVGGDGSSYFNLPNSGGIGNSTSATFSMHDTNCDTVMLSCGINLTAQGPGNFSYNGPCGEMRPTAPLPLKLISFDMIEEVNEYVDFSWKTDLEMNLSHFELQSALSRNNWITVDSRIADNRSTGSKYQMRISKSQLEQYIRLKMIDFDGNFTYSEVLILDKSDDEVLVYPNPVTDILNIKNAEFNIVYAIDLMGRKFQLNTIDVNSIDVSGLNTGQYTLLLMSKERRYSSARFYKD